uniref:Uncharacterized protein n=1 Tax=Rhizophora mucronata TaxID=61149 RepID=A0A2P2R1Y5_RHIMU
MILFVRRVSKLSKVILCNFI